MARKPKKTNSDIDTTERLILAATEVFAEKGFDGATVKEIADRAGVNISLISYHFEGKEGIFRKCVEKFGQNRLREAEQILTPPESVEDLKAKVKLWMQQFLLCQIEDSKVCKIMHREDMMERDFMKDIFESTFLKAFEAMVKFLQTAKKNGIVKEDIDPLIAAGIIYGALIHMGRTRSIQKNKFGTSIDQEKFRTKTVDQFVHILLKGVI